MQKPSAQIQALSFWQDTLVRSLSRSEVDLSNRQMAIMLAIYLSEGPHSVKSLSGNLNISKAATCRALDVLCRAGLVRRKRDEDDKRNVYVQRTVKGSVYLSEFSDVIMDSSAEHLKRAA